MGDELQKVLLSNPRSMLREIGILKHQMQQMGKEMEQISKTARGERTLGQHIHKLSEVIMNAEEVKNLMQKIPMMEAKQRVMDKDICNIQGRVSKLKTQLGNMENQVKQLLDSVSKNGKKVESVKGKDQLTLKDLVNIPRAQSKRIEETSKMDEENIAAGNMQTLVDQAFKLVESTQLVICCSFAIFSYFVSCDLLFVSLGGLSHVVVGSFSLLIFSLALFQIFYVVKVSGPLKPTFT